MIVKHSHDRRLEQLAVTVQSVSNIQLQLSETMKELASRMDGVEEHQAAVVRAQRNLIDIVDRMEQQIEKLTRIPEMLMESNCDLTKVIQRLADSQVQVVKITENLEHTLTSTNAAVERLDRLMDFVLLRDSKQRQDNDVD